MVYLKNQIVTVKITDMSENGEGIGRTDGYTLFVKDALIGDEVKASLTKVKKNYAFARVDEIITPSDDRTEPPCRMHRKCGGCQIQAMSYKAQLKYKENKVKSDLIRIGGFDESFIEDITEPIIGMENPLRYRNKAQYPIGLSKNGEIIAGFFAARTHDIIANIDCYLGTSENKEILEKIISFMKKNAVMPYDEKTGRGVIRHVLIRKGFTTGEIMVCVVINADTLKDSDRLVDALVNVKGMTSICININKKNTNVILGNKCRTLWGKDFITDYIGDVKFKISPLSFFQVNPVQTKKLYEKALEYAQLTGKENVWDLYCGIGTISLFLAKCAGHVTGVEIIPEAIDDAKENAKINGIKNASFYVGDAQDVAEEILNGSIKDPDNVCDINDVGDQDASGAFNTDKSKVTTESGCVDVIVVDPPRKGLDKKLIHTILSVKPSRVVYVSCDPATLSRDLRLLCENSDYELTHICPVDQFPHSVHVETVVLIQRVGT